MDIKGRRTLYLTAIVVFLIAAPVLLLYSQGYRFDLRTRSFIHIGAISIDSIPHNAQISIDGANVQRSTPALVSNKYPGTYHIELAQQGFQPWSTDIVVAPSNTALLYATMLPTSSSRHYATDSSIIAAASTAVNGKIAVAYKSTDTIIVAVVSSDNGTMVPLAHYTIDDPSALQLEWSSHGKYLAVVQPDMLLSIIDVTAQTETFSDKTHHVHTIVFNPSNDNMAYALGEGTLWQVDLLKETSYVVASPHVAAASFDGSALWIARDTDEGTAIERIDLSSPTQVQESRIIPYGVDDQMVIQSGTCIIPTTQATYVFKIQDDAITVLPITGITNVQAGSDKNKLLLTATSEVWTLDLALMDTSLLVRQAGIQSTRWFPNRNTAIVLSKDTLRLHDLVVRTASSGQLGPFDHALSIVDIDEKTIAVISASAIDILSY
jgi:hypothetical protein